MEDQRKNLSELERKYFELFGERLCDVAEEDDGDDLRQPLWSKVVPSLTCTDTTSVRNLAPKG